MIAMKRSSLGLLLMLILLNTAQAQDFSGTWDVTGSDPALGAYSGAVSVQRSASGYTVRRLVQIARPLPDGRTLALAWEGTARNDPGGLRVEVALLQQQFVAQGAGLTRGPQHAAPLLLTALLQAQGGSPRTFAPGQRVQGSFVSIGGPGPDDVWIKSARSAPSIPAIERRMDLVPPTVPRRLLFLLLRDYHRLPSVAAYASRPEFQAAAYAQVVDTTGRDYTRAHPDHLLVVQKVADGIALIEEGLRASAYRWKLTHKALGWQRALETDHIEASTGMLGGRNTQTGEHLVHGDSGLHQGVWVASQAYRYEVTGDPQALTNVESGTRALISMCVAPGNPAEFARAVQEASTAPANWSRSTALPGLAYIPGGNNDMLHGVEYGFAAAEHVLTPGHPLLAEVGQRAKLLVEHSKVGGDGGMHQMILGGVAARLTGDAGVRSRYRRALWKPLNLLWTLLGQGIPFFQELGGRSGPHLGLCTLASLRWLGGTQPDWLERIWRRAAIAGTSFAFRRTEVTRPGNLSALAALHGAPNAAQVLKDVLSEIPYPKPMGPDRIDITLQPGFCLSPYPEMPWKLDFLTAPNRRQGLYAYPLWVIGDSDNYWKEGPYQNLNFGGASPIAWSRQDYLHTYWLGRLAGALSAND